MRLYPDYMKKVKNIMITEMISPATDIPLPERVSFDRASPIALNTMPSGQNKKEHTSPATAMPLERGASSCGRGPEGGA